MFAIKISFHSKDLTEGEVVKRRKLNVWLKRVGIISVVTFILLGLVFYWTPKPVEKVFYACTEEGEVIEIAFHLYWQPMLFSPSKLKGYIILDGTYFYSPFGYRLGSKVYPPYVRGGGYSFTFQKTWEIKRGGDQFIPHFLPGDAQGNIDLEVRVDKDLCSMQSNSKDFDKVYIYWWKPETSKAFFGPAQNTDEVKTVLAELRAELWQNKLQ